MEKIENIKLKQKLINWKGVKQIINKMLDQERIEFLTHLYDTLIKAKVLTLDSDGAYEIMEYHSVGDEKLTQKEKNKKGLHAGPYPCKNGNLYFTSKESALEYLKVFHPQCLVYKTM